MGRVRQHVPASRKNRSPAQRKRQQQRKQETQPQQVVHFDPYANVKKHNLWGVPTLGQLRDLYTTTNSPAPDASSCLDFEHIYFDDGDYPEQFHLLHGKDGGPLGFYVPPEYVSPRLPSNWMDTLIDLAKDLPPLEPSQEAKNLESRRGIPNSRTYASWRAYRAADILAYSARYQKDNEKDGKGEALVRHCQPLWELGGSVYKEIASKSHTEMDRPELIPFHVAPLAKPFTAMTINCGSSDSPVVSKPHRDVQDAFFQMSCLFPFGYFRGGGAVVMWELKKIIHLRPMSLFFFPAHLITHSNTPVDEGDRGSLVGYMKEEMAKYLFKQGATQIRTRLPVTLKNSRRAAL
jgi:hypothetical protein